MPPVEGLEFRTAWSTLAVHGKYALNTNYVLRIAPGLASMGGVALGGNPGQPLLHHGLAVGVFLVAEKPGGAPADAHGGVAKQLAENAAKIFGGGEKIGFIVRNLSNVVQQTGSFSQFGI